MDTVKRFRAKDDIVLVVPRVADWRLAVCGYDDSVEGVDVRVDKRIDMTPAFWAGLIVLCVVTIDEFAIST
jgi:hypothetical protein